MYVHFNNLFHTLKNLKYIAVHAVQVNDDLGMRWMDGIYIGLYTNVWIDLRKDEKFSEVNWHTRIE